jgi:hypothetical protein
MHIVILVGLALTVILNIVILAKIDQKKSEHYSPGVTDCNSCVKVYQGNTQWCACGNSIELNNVKKLGCMNKGGSPYCSEGNITQAGAMNSPQGNC